jgi:c-di-GMP-binding flagellar brake protein YcgR
VKVVRLERLVRSNPQREFLRHTIRVPLEVHRVADSSPLREQSVNVSFGGLAFLSSTCPRIGEVLRLRIAIVEPVFEADARVAWCTSEAEKFLIGVEFLDSQAAFQSRMVQQVCSIENYRQEVQEREGRALTTQEAASEWIAKYAGRFPDSETATPDDSAA